MINEVLDIDEFLNGYWTSNNGLLLRDMIERVYDDHDELPTPYKTFICDLGKNTAVCGYLQCTGPDALQILMVRDLLSL